LIFNPNKNTGFAIDTQTKLKEHFLTYQISALESSLITEDHINNMRTFYADDPNGWRVCVEGLPPLDDEDALIPYSALTEAEQRSTSYEFYKDYPKVSGFDVGAGGDKSAIAIIQGPKCHTPIHTFNSSNENEIQAFGVNTFENELIEKMACDGIGIGMFMAKMLKDHGLDAVRVDVRTKSPDPKFYNLRAYLYWQLRLWIMNGGDIPEDPQLKKELAVLKKEEKNGRLIVISKEKLKAEGNKSPNKADAMMLAMYFKNMIAIKSRLEEKKKRDRYREPSEQQLISWLGL